jgi:hypothetical protein
VSPELTITNIGGNVNPAPSLFPGLVSFNLHFVPEPNVVALAGLFGALLIFRPPMSFPKRVAVMDADLQAKLKFECANGLNEKSGRRNVTTGKQWSPDVTVQTSRLARVF